MTFFYRHFHMGFFYPPILHVLQIEIRTDSRQMLESILESIQDLQKIRLVHRVFFISTGRRPTPCEQIFST